MDGSNPVSIPMKTLLITALAIVVTLVDRRLAAAAASERADVYRLKYQVFVEELGRAGSAADHERRVLEEADDPGSHLIQARLKGGLVGALRLIWGGDGDFTDATSRNLELVSSRTRAVLLEDFDADGDVELWSGNEKEDRIFTNLSRQLAWRAVPSSLHVSNRSPSEYNSAP